MHLFVAKLADLLASLVCVVAIGLHIGLLSSHTSHSSTATATGLSPANNSEPSVSNQQQQHHLFGDDGRNQSLGQQQQQQQQQQQRQQQQRTNQPGAFGQLAISQTVAGFLFTNWTIDGGARLNRSDPIDQRLASVLARDGPDMRPSRDFNEAKDVGLNVSLRAWRLLHDNTQVAVKNRIELAWPALQETLISAKASPKCRLAVESTLEAAKRLESWAIRLLSSWGSFPISGLFEGTYSHVGSFHTCYNIDEVGQQQRHSVGGHAHYCSITFKPVLASARDYELVVRKEPRELLELFVGKTNQEQQQTSEDPRSSNRSTAPESQQTKQQPQQQQQQQAKPRDAFTDILEHAQYHHYVYYKLGTCWPINCSPFDVKRIVKLVAERNILIHGPVKCYSKFSDDYEEPDDTDAADLAAAAAAEWNNANGTQRTDNRPTKVTISAPPRLLSLDDERTSNASKPKKSKLVVSTWDKNDGIYIWKPSFNQTQKCALAVVLAATVFVLLMTLIDLFWLRMPYLICALKLALKGLPLSTAAADQHQSIGQDTNELQPRATTTTSSGSFALCSGAGSTAKLTTSGALDGATATENANAPPAATTTIDHEQMLGNQIQLRSQCSLRPVAKRASNSSSSSSFFASLVDDCSIITNAPAFFRVSESQLKNDILCLNGIRCITMLWILMAHSLMYIDWSAWSRTRHVEVAIKSPVAQPLFNACYLVDTFFLMSGLLSSYAAFKHSRGLRNRFNSIAFMLGRWLRLTPQIFFVSMIYIIFPALSHGPHWFPVVGEFSENCQSNWWVNVFHLQAFYRQAEMCNFVTWWISVDYFYHFFALIVIWITMSSGHKFGLLSLGTLVLAALSWQCWKHYTSLMPPNIFSTIPYTGTMWSTMVLQFFFTPQTHAVPFSFGFYTGYLFAMHQTLVHKLLNTRRALLGWLISISLLIVQQYSTFWWVIGEADYSPLVATVFYTLCAITWAGSICWIIIACHFNYGGFINRILSCRSFIVLGKASYLVYLSHFQILFIYYGNQSLLLEPTPLNISYIILGNILLSASLGVVLCIVYELPWLKAQRRIMKYV